MRYAIGLVALGVAWLPIAAAYAQPASQPTQQDIVQQLKEYFNQQLQDRDRRYEDELQKRDARIAQLESELRASRTPAAAATGETPTPPGALSGASPPAGAESPSPAILEQRKKDLLAQIDANLANQAFQRNPVSFNPDIAVIANFLGTASDDKNNKALNRMDVGEVELEMRAAVDPRADGIVVLSFARDVDNPLFPDAGFEAEGPDAGAEFEEGYLFLHDFGVPNLTAKLGRFRTRFGRQNLIHSHDLPTSDVPMVLQSFLAPEALTDAGVSFSYLIPNPWNAYLEGVVEVISGEGASSESPTLAGGLGVCSPAVNMHFLWNTDVGPHWNLELGGSFLEGSAGAGTGDPGSPNGKVNLYGMDATLIHTDPTGGFNNLLLQSEAIFGDVVRTDMSDARAAGAYLLAQQQLNRDWYVGVRGDWTQDALDPSRQVWAVSPYVSWYWSEFLRFRVEVQHREGGGRGDENILFFQVTWLFGAHPPHPYWSMK